MAQHDPAPPVPRRQGLGQGETLLTNRDIGIGQKENAGIRRLSPLGRQGLDVSESDPVAELGPQRVVPGRPSDRQDRALRDAFDQHPFDCARHEKNRPIVRTDLDPHQRPRAIAADGGMHGAMLVDQVDIELADIAGHARAAGMGEQPGRQRTHDIDTLDREGNTRLAPGLLRLQQSDRLRRRVEQRGMQDEPFRPTIEAGGQNQFGQGLAFARPAFCDSLESPAIGQAAGREKAIELLPRSLCGAVRADSVQVDAFRRRCRFAGQVALGMSSRRALDTKTRALSTAFEGHRNRDR